MPRCQNNAILPLDHHPFQALLYHSLVESAPDYANALHQQGCGSEYSSKRFRLFVFSRCYLADRQIREAVRVKDGHLVFPPGPVEWQVCSPVPDFIQAFIAGLAMKQTVIIRDSYAAQNLEVAEIAIVEPPPFTARMFFHTMSPITVSIRDPNPDGSPGKHYVRAGDERFGPLVRINLIEKFRALAGCDPGDSRLQFEFDQEFIRKRGGVDRISKLVQFKETRIKAFQAPFVVTGSVELIQLGWECGFGNANSQGFGMVE